MKDELIPPVFAKILEGVEAALPRAMQLDVEGQKWVRITSERWWWTTEGQLRKEQIRSQLRLLSLCAYIDGLKERIEALERKNP